MVSGTRIAEWLQKLVRIPSVSPAQAGPRAGVPGEAALAAELAAQFRALGGEVTVEEILPGRPNVYARWTGCEPRWAAVDAHMDTVGVEQMTSDPFSGDIRDGRVWGRGSVDTKASLAVVLALLEETRHRNLCLRPNLLIAATMDEEVDAQGAPAFARWLRQENLKLDELAVAEPTLCGPVVAHRGALRLAFEVEGIPAHSSQPHFGRNALTAAARIVLAMDREHQRLQAEAARSPFGAPTLTPTLIQGGTGANVVPDATSLTIDRRLVPGESAEDVEARLISLAREACPLPVRVRRLKQIDPFSQPAGAPWVRNLVEWSGREPAFAPYGTNAWAYSGVAEACVVIGPGSIDQAHGVEEWVEIAELEKLAAIYARWWGLSDT